MIPINWKRDFQVNCECSHIINISSFGSATFQKGKHKQKVKCLESTPLWQVADTIMKTKNKTFQGIFEIQALDKKTHPFISGRRLVDYKLAFHC